MFSEYATEIKIVDEAAGEFLEVSQTWRTDLGKIAINPEEWPTLRDAMMTDDSAERRSPLPRSGAMRDGGKAVKP